MSLPSVPFHWRAAGIGDANGDGRADVLWREADGRNYLWISVAQPVPRYNVAQGIHLATSECPADFAPQPDTDCSVCTGTSRFWS